ncbi:hypothetical protein EYR41_002576 [Orbilia oligospora]|uniref:PA14 domain-containing protein n=1 Tax=Orbilia oligospora TaxID=2813651 RepID=A0A8H2E4X4_ORBOL|nr:hypothetical protein EYR41_002576 [Orbilia oligospora]
MTTTFLFLLLSLGLPLAQGQSSTVTSFMTVTQIETSTFIPTVTISNKCNGTSSSTSLQLCENLLATWDPFGISSNSSTSRSTSSSRTSHSFTTTTTTTTRPSSTSSIPTPGNLYVFSATDTETLDINSSGNVILSNPSSGLTAAFILNADGTLTSYGSNVKIFADFSDTVTSKRAINTAYSLGFCLSKSILHRRGRARGHIIIFPRAAGADGKSYGQFSISSSLLQLDSDGSTYGWVNCVSNNVAVYDTASDDVPGDCGAIDLTASSVPTASYSQYYSAGLKRKSQISGVSTCSISPGSSSSISTTSSRTGGATGTTTSGIDVLPDVPSGTLTNTAAEADFTSTEDPFPVFAMAAFNEGNIYVNDDLQLVMRDRNGTDFHGFQLTSDDQMVFYGGNFTVYANTSVRTVDSIDDRAICYENRIMLMLSLDGSYPAGATIGPFITDPDVGLLLLNWVFLACDEDSHLEIAYLDCPVREGCMAVNPALFLLDSLSRQQALYNGAILAQKAVPTSTYIEPNATTIVLYETNAVNAVRDILLQGGYYEFCSSELGFYFTSTVTETEVTIVSTETTAATETLSVVDYSAVVIEQVTTATTFQTTTTTTSPFNIPYTTTSRSVSWTTTTTSTTSFTSTRTTTTTAYTCTSLMTINTIAYATKSPPVTSGIFTTTSTTTTRRGRDLGARDVALRERVQDATLTPTYIQPFDAVIVASACSLYFEILYNNFGVTPTSLTFMVDETSIINGTETTYSSTSTSTASTSYNVLGTVTSYSFTTTTTIVSTSLSINTNYVTSTTRTTTTAIELQTKLVKTGTLTTTTTTGGSTTRTVIDARTTTVCRLRHRPTNGVIGGQLISGGREPLDNFTTTRNITYDLSLSEASRYQERGYVLWRQLPGGFPAPDAPIDARVQADKYRNETGWAWVGWNFFTCPQTTYRVSVTYKWFFDKNNQQSVFGLPDAADYYKNSEFSFFISGLGDESYKNVNAYDVPLPSGKAASLDGSPDGALRMTREFTAVSWVHGVYFGLSWRFRHNYTTPVLTAQQYMISTNRLLIYGFNMSDDIPLADRPGVSWFLPN